MIKSVKLSALCKMQSGGTPSRSNLDYYEGDFPWAKISDLEKSDDGYIYKTEEHITQEALQSINNRQFQPGTLLLAMYGSVGKTAITKIHLTTNQAILGINILDDSVLDIKYLKYWFSTIKERLLNRAVGAALPNISLGIVKDLEIPLPPLPQQQKIANILNAADALRQNDKALIEKYDELTQALFLDMFGDPVSNPKGWDVVKLKDISTKIHSGNTPKGGSEVYVETGITFFRSQNVWKKRLVYEDIAFIDQETHSKMMKSSLKHKDILMTKTGRINTENSSLGRAAIYLGEDDKANVNGHVYLIRLKKGALNEFVLHILTTKEYRGHIRSVCVGGIDKRQLNKEHIENFPIINPDMDLQIRFSKQLEVIEEQKSIAQKSLEKSESLFNSLLQKAFKGELV